MKAKRLFRVAIVVLIIVSALASFAFAQEGAPLFATTNVDNSGGITPEMLAPFVLVAFGLLSLTGGVAGYAWRRRNGDQPEPGGGRRPCRTNGPR